MGRQAMGTMSEGSMFVRCTGKTTESSLRRQSDALLRSWVSFVLHQWHGRDAVPLREIMQWVDDLLLRCARICTAEEMQRLEHAAVTVIARVCSSEECNKTE